VKLDAEKIHSNSNINKKKRIVEPLDNGMNFTFSKAY
jgi:hypothetical protein